MENMNNKKIKEIIINKLYETGIHKAGVTAAQDLTKEKKLAEILIKDSFIENKSGISVKINSFYSPPAFMPEGRSIIMTALSYYEETTESNISEEPTGKIALYTQRNNYKFLRKKLEKISKFIKKNFNGTCKIFVNGPLAEKPLATRAAIGHYGKNGIIYAENYGSRIVLGGVITDLPLPPDSPSEKDICKKCGLCMKLCPTGAIVKPYTLDRNRCIQYLSQHIDVEIPQDYRNLWGARLYGCSTCQDVCPLNKNLSPPSSLSPYGVIGPEVPLIQLLNMSEEEFKEKYRDNQISAKWVDFDAIKRNALISLINSGSYLSTEVIKKFTKDETYQVREIAGWALKNYKKKTK